MYETDSSFELRVIDADAFAAFMAAKGITAVHRLFGEQGEASEQDGLITGWTTGRFWFDEEDEAWLTAGVRGTLEYGGSGDWQTNCALVIDPSGVVGFMGGVFNEWAQMDAHMERIWTGGKP